MAAYKLTGPRVPAVRNDDTFFQYPTTAADATWRVRTAAAGRTGAGERAPAPPKPASRPERGDSGGHAAMVPIGASRRDDQPRRAGLQAAAGRRQQRTFDLIYPEP
ncbi:hypothetical protein LXA47_28755 [Massilia sp. P8910]|uniref:hypothetical protein n=1 Tax=Massilia antarctica TaxID=2765360 RepID=UPI0006BB6977|nr:MULTISPECIES: hypothetical protein [Massilia]MCE3607565.1 hypothetical protein [Massilia antarctica]MCY0910249.1 hypothetical protein [Massilia sp. H27-R4]